MTSIDTGIELKNKHAQSDKWFDAAKYPRITFRSKLVARTDTGFVVNGDLELKGVKKEITIPFGFRQYERQSQFYGKFKVNRETSGSVKLMAKNRLDGS